MKSERPTNPSDTERAHPHAASFPSPPGRRRSLSSFFLTFFIMMGLWVPLSGMLDAFHLSLGVISCALVAYWSGDLLFPSVKVADLPVSWFRFVRYLPWLLYQILLSNLHLMYLAFHPRMMDLIDPKVIYFRSRLRSDLSLVTFANSITLTPGTITVDVSIHGDFKVHAIDRMCAEALPGEMEERIAKTFREG